MSVTSLREDKELRDFFQKLVSSFMNAESQFARIDFLNCPVAQNTDGEKLIQQLGGLLKIPVRAYSDILGEPEMGEREARYSLKINSI